MPFAGGGDGLSSLLFLLRNDNGEELLLTVDLWLQSLRPVD